MRARRDFLPSARDRLEERLVMSHAGLAVAAQVHQLSAHAHHAAAPKPAAHHAGKGAVHGRDLNSGSDTTTSTLGSGATFLSGALALQTPASAFAATQLGSSGLGSGFLSPASVVGFNGPGIVNQGLEGGFVSSNPLTFENGFTVNSAPDINTFLSFEAGFSTNIDPNVNSNISLDHSFILGSP